jgi:hypothetical protein
MNGANDVTKWEASNAFMIMSAPFMYTFLVLSRIRSAGWRGGGRMLTFSMKPHHDAIPEGLEKTA